LAIPFSLRWRGWHANTHVNVVEKRADNLRERQQEASGISNATRELGGVFGIAISGLIFQSGAAIQTPDDFGVHLVPALWTGAAMIVLGVAFALLFAGTLSAGRKLRRAEAQ